MRLVLLLIVLAFAACRTPTEPPEAPSCEWPEYREPSSAMVAPIAVTVITCGERRIYVNE
jgi:hypothetical protein